MSRFGTFKDAAAMVSAAPALIEQAHQLATEAQLFAAAQQTVFTVGAVAPGGFAPLPGHDEAAVGADRREV